MAELVAGDAEHLQVQRRHALDGPAPRQSADDPVDLVAVVLDLTMPVVSGHEALSQIRALDPTIPVLVTSGFSEEALAHGITTGRETAFLQKPFNPTALISALEELCRSR